VSIVPVSLELWDLTQWDLNFKGLVLHFLPLVPRISRSFDLVLWRWLEVHLPRLVFCGFYASWWRLVFFFNGDKSSVLQVEGVPATLVAIWFSGATQHTEIVSAELESLLLYNSFIVIDLYGTLLYGFVCAGFFFPICSSLTPVNVFALCSGGSDSLGEGCEHRRDESDLLHLLFYF
jgi:hypothetical protein